MKFKQLILTELGAKILSHPLISAVDQADVEVVPQIYFGVNEKQTEPPFTGLCRIRIEAKLLAEDDPSVDSELDAEASEGVEESSDDADRDVIATAVVEYVGRFDYDSTDVDSYIVEMSTEENHLLLINQLYPLVVFKLKSLIEEMGFSSESIPLNPPEPPSQEDD